MENTKELLDEYTDWLVDNHYADADVYTEEPTAVDRFIAYKATNIQ